MSSVSLINCHIDSLTQCPSLLATFYVLDLKQNQSLLFEYQPPVTYL